MENLRPILKLINLKLTKESELLSKRIYTGNWSREIFATNSVLKTNPWTYKIKDIIGEKIARSFYEKELLLSL